jgi:hypothetical protein
MSVEIIENNLMKQWFLLHNISLKNINLLPYLQIKSFFDEIISKYMKIIESGFPIFDIILKYTKLEYFTEIKFNLKNNNNNFVNIPLILSIIIIKYSEECIPIVKDRRLMAYNSITQKEKKHIYKKKL